MPKQDRLSNELGISLPKNRQELNEAIQTLEDKPGLALKGEALLKAKDDYWTAREVLVKGNMGPGTYISEMKKLWENFVQEIMGVSDK